MVIAADGRVRVAEDLAEFRVAEEPLDLALYLLVEFEEFVADVAKYGNFRRFDVRTETGAPEAREP
jgi:hypothetical protein